MKYTKFVYKKVFDFYQNEQGVYALLTGAISFVLLGIIALAVDGSGMLLDKARLSQGMEQGALALSAEANKPRISQNEDLSGNGYFTAKTVTPADKKDSRFASKSEKEIRGYKRDQELLKSYVQSYLPDAKLPRDFEYDCEEKSTPKRVVSCWAQGDIDRPSWLPLNDTSLTFQPEVKIASDRVYVGKNLDDVAPLDLMLVTDLSGSMNKDENNQSGGQSKISILREVVATIGDELLDNKTQREDISPYNRIRFTSFAFGATQANQNECTLPYELTSEGKNNLLSTKVAGGYSTLSGLTYFDAWKKGVMDKLSLSNTTLMVYGHFLDTLTNKGIDYNATVSSIAKFDGSNRTYALTFPKNDWCLGGSASPTTSNKWYHKGEVSSLKQDLNSLKPNGATLSSSGVLIGANLLMNKNDEAAAQPGTLRTNTQRILLVLSDGRDEIYANPPSPVIPPQLHITANLIEKGMCKAIRERLNTLQDTNYSRKNARIHFVAFGYTASGLQKQRWLECVGTEGYHEAKNKQQLLETFRQIVGLQEEVGHVTPNKVF